MKHVLTLILAATLLQGGAAAQYRISVDPGRIINHISPLLYGSGMEDVNHEVYGGIYNQRIFGESFEEGAPTVRIAGFTAYDTRWHGVGDYVYPTVNNASAKLICDTPENGTGTLAVDLRFESIRPGSAGVYLHASAPGEGTDQINGYEFGLSAGGKKFTLWKVQGARKELGSVNIDFSPWDWHRLSIQFRESEFLVRLDGRIIFAATDAERPFVRGLLGLRTRNADASFRNLTLQDSTGEHALPLERICNAQVSAMWRPYTDAKASGYSFSLDREDAFNGKQSQVVENRGAGRVGVTNMSLNHWGIGLKKGQVFQGSFYAKGTAGKVWVALQSEDGSREYGRTRIGAVSGDWKAYTFTLKSAQDDPKARFAIFMEGKGRIHLDQVTLTGTGSDLYKGYPLRADIARALVDEGLTFLRYGGSMTNSPEFSFRNMTGPRPLRQPYRGQWYHFSTNGFGIVEFLQLAEACGFEPSFAVQVEEDPASMRFMVEYLKGSAETPGGRQRVADGHPEPYRIRYIEIGNEECIFWKSEEAYAHYIERFNLLADAMLAVDPSLELVCAAWWRPDQKAWMEKVFRGVEGKAAYWDLHTTTDSFAGAQRVDGTLAQMKAWFREWNPGTEMKIAVFEENGATHNVQRMLGHVINQNAVRRHGDFVLTSCAANALEPYRQNDNGWNQGQVFFTPTQVWGMPPFHAQQMASAHHQSNLVESKADGGLDVTATVSDDGSCVVLHIANISGKGAPLKLEVSGFDAPSSIREISLSGALTDVNSPEEPRKIVPVERRVSKLEDLYIKPHSYTLIELRP